MGQVFGFGLAGAVRVGWVRGVWTCNLGCVAERDGLAGRKTRRSRRATAAFEVVSGQVGELASVHAL